MDHLHIFEARLMQKMSFLIFACDPQSIRREIILGVLADGTVGRIAVPKGIINPSKSWADLHRVVRALWKIRIQDWCKQILFIPPIKLRNDFIWLLREDWSDRRRFLIKRCFADLAMHVLFNFLKIFLSMLLCKCFCLRVLDKGA